MVVDKIGLTDSSLPVIQVLRTRGTMFDFRLPRGQNRWKKNQSQSRPKKQNRKK